MKCGGCGSDLFRIYKIEDGLASECVQCASVSEITVSRPEILVDWTKEPTEKDDGLLCVWKKQ